MEQVGTCASKRDTGHTEDLHHLSRIDVIFSDLSADNPGELCCADQYHEVWEISC
jgi:hypothetical protein